MGIHKENRTTITEVKRRLGKLESSPKSQKPSPAFPVLTIDPDQFPFVPVEARPRKIIFDHLPPQDVGELERRGYRVLILRTMPRETPTDSIQWLLALLQGVTDGTVELSKARAEATFLDMKARGLFNRGDATINLKVQAVGEDVKSILSWGESRHTLDGNTTITDPKQIEELARRALGVTNEGRPLRKGKN